MNTNAVAVYAEQPQARPAQAHVAQFDETQLSLLKNTICKGATDDEFALFVQVAKHSGLDPFAKQIHAVKRYDGKLGREVMSIQTSVDGFRLIAQRTGAYKGQTSPEWCGEDMVWHPVWLSETPPSAARIGVHREGFAEPCWGIARWKSYAQSGKNGLMPMWSRMPDVMLAKCAECLALRKAFPQEMHGLYADDEMPAPEVKREKTTSAGEVVKRKPDWKDDQKKKGGELRALFMPIGGEKWFGSNLQRMGYDEPAAVLTWFQNHLDKWSTDQAEAAKGNVESLYAAGLNHEMDRLSPSWDWADPLSVIDSLAALLRTADEA